MFTINDAAPGFEVISQKKVFSEKYRYFPWILKWS